MFEYWFLGTEVPFHGTTLDFLQICTDIAKEFNPVVAGKFVEALMIDQKEHLDYLRMIEWKFDYTDVGVTIKIHHQGSRI